jgi:hypothetical protein
LEDYVDLEALQAAVLSRHEGLGQYQVTRDSMLELDGYLMKHGSSSGELAVDLDPFLFSLAGALEFVDWRVGSPWDQEEQMCR